MALSLLTDKLPFGVAFLDGGHSVIYSNETMNKIAVNAKGTVNSIIRDITTSNRNSSEHIKSKNCNFQAMASKSCGQSISTCLFINGGNTHYHGNLITGIVIVFSPDVTPSVDASVLSNIYGLTTTEARVAALLAIKGEPLENISEAMGISLNTVRSHLKKIYMKLGIHGQADLVRLLLLGPALYLNRPSGSPASLVVGEPPT